MTPKSREEQDHIAEGKPNLSSEPGPGDPAAVKNDPEKQRGRISRDTSRSSCKHESPGSL